jgi:hypothetical protein
MGIAYTGLFIIAFSGLANFGLLARQRVQLLPLFFVLLAVPPQKDEEPEPETVQELARPAGV